MSVSKCKILKRNGVIEVPFELLYTQQDVLHTWGW